MSSIESARLSLRPLDIASMELLLAGDRAAAGHRIGCQIPEDMALDSMPLARRLKQLRDDPTLEPWLLRAIVERGSSTMIGHINFHSRPRPDDLANVAPDGVELGYTVSPTHRRQGFAREAAIALMHWAYENHEQRCFVLSISPNNLPSTAMAKSLGFTECGSHTDEEDGLEIEFLRRFDRWPAEWRVG